MQQVNDRWRRCWTLVVAVLFVFTIVTVFLVNLIPLEIAGSIDEGLSELAAGLGFRLDDSISISLVQRLIVYVPLGLLTYALIALRKLRAPFLGTILLVALVGLSVEMLQGFFSKRHAFSSDFLLVLIVGVLAALSGEILRGLLARRRLALLQLLLLGNVLGLSAIWLAHRGSDLASWDCSYPLVIGNEATADRPWLGRLRGVAIYDRALADGQIGALSAGSGGQDGVDRRDLGAALVRPFDDDGELEIARPTLVQAMQDATGLCEAIKASQAFTIEIEFASLDLDQRGPARILSMSLDPERRNVTLGQDGGRLSLRIRNELNGANGIEQEITTADDVVSGDWQRWIVRYDRGLTTLFLDGEILRPSFDYTSVLLVSGRQSLPINMITGVVSLLLGVVAFGWLRGRTKRGSSRLLAAAGLALAPQIAIVLLIAVTSHRLMATSVILAIIPATIVGILFSCWLDRSTSWFRSMSS